MSTDTAALREALKKANESRIQMAEDSAAYWEKAYVQAMAEVARLQSTIARMGAEQ